MRKTCLDCVRKHLGTAYVLLGEYADDPVKYLTHFWYAVGHLEEATRECWATYPQAATAIRNVRLELMHNDDFWPDFDILIKLICKLADEENAQKEEKEASTLHAE